MTALLIPTIIYLSTLFIIGAVYLAKIRTLNEFCIGARKVKSVDIGFSAQISELGVFIVILIPANIYLMGVGSAWIIAGLFLGVLFTWYLMSYRLMRYSNKYKNAYTLPAYFGKRYGKRSDILSVVCASINILFDIFMCASLIRLLAIITSAVFGLSLRFNIVIIFLTCIGLVMIGGYSGSTKMNFVNAILIIMALLVLPIVCMILFKADELIVALMNSRVSGGVTRYLNLMAIKGDDISIMKILSQLSWGLTLFGLPGMMAKFMSIDKARTVKHGGRNAYLITLFALFFATLNGVLVRAFIYPVILRSNGFMNVPSLTVNKLKSMSIGYQIAGGILFVGMIAAVLAMIISKMASGFTVMYCDIIKTRILKKYRIKKNLLAIRITAAGVGAVILGLSFVEIEPYKVIRLLIICASGFFGAVTLLSLYDKRMNKYGSLAGMIAGFFVSLFWSFIEVIKYDDGLQTLENYTGLNAIIPSFVISVIVAFIVSRLTPDVTDKVKSEFDEVKNRIS